MAGLPVTVFDALESSRDNSPPAMPPIEIAPYVFLHTAVAAMDAAGIQCVSEAKIETARRMSQKSRIKETSFNDPDSHF